MKQTIKKENGQREMEPQALSGAAAIRARVGSSFHTDFLLLGTNQTIRLMKENLTIKEAQQLVDQWIKEYGVRYFSELTNMACLTEEVGELARVMARRYGDQSFKEGEKTNLGEEMADVLWVLICLANQTGVDLTEEFRRSMEKKTTRDARRHLDNPKLQA